MVNDGEGCRTGVGVVMMMRLRFSISKTTRKKSGDVWNEDDCSQEVDAGAEARASPEYGEGRAALPGWGEGLDWYVIDASRFRRLQKKGGWEWCGARLGLMDWRPTGC